MSLSGTFDTMQLPDVLQWIHSTQRSGTLIVTAELNETYLVFAGGDLLAVGSDNPALLNVGQQLLAEGLVSEEQLETAAVEHGGELSLLDALRAQGVVDGAEAVRVQEELAANAVLELFFVEEGTFHFSDGAAAGLLSSDEIPAGIELPRPLASSRLIFDGMRRLDEWNRVRQIFPSSYVVVEASPGDTDNPVWRQLLFLGEPISVGELCLHVGGSRFFVYRKLFEAYHQGLILIDASAPAGPTGGDAGTADMLVNSARLMIEERQFDEARTLLVTAANLDPDNGETRSALRRLRREHKAYLYQQVQPYWIPRQAVPRAQLAQLSLSPREQYLISRLKSGLDVSTLIVATPLGEMETLRILHKLKHAGLVEFEK